jgi:hypothetical protein
MNAFRNVLALYRRPWEKLKRSVSAGSYVVGPIEHGNGGTHHRHDSSNQRRCEKSIQLYLKDLADSYADCYATRFIREKTSVGLRNTEISVIKLPSNMTYRISTVVGATALVTSQLLIQRGTLGQYIYLRKDLTMN